MYFESPVFAWKKHNIEVDVTDNLHLKAVYPFVDNLWLFFGTRKMFGLTNLRKRLFSCDDVMLCNLV